MKNRVENPLVMAAMATAAVAVARPGSFADPALAGFRAGLARPFMGLHHLAA